MEPRAESPGRAKEEDRARATILNVNDTPAVLYLTSRILTVAGYHVVEATSGTEALRLAGGRPDMVLLDVHLPDVDGYEVCRRLRAREETRDLLIAHLSAVSVSREDRLRGLAQGADAYWTTPLGDDELLANVEALLRLQSRAQAAVHARDEFLSIAAHELRTPLTALRLNLERLVHHLTRVPGDAVARRTVEASTTPALRQLVRLQQLLDTLLDVSRVGSRKLRLDIEVFDLAEAAREVAGRLAMSARAAGTELSLALPLGPALLMGDRLRLEQVISNLLANAFRYGDGKPIWLTVEEHPDALWLSVTDQGIGIAKQDQSRIFNRFERASSTGRADGLGLGLFIAREIVVAHGGTLTVESEPGQGATFHVTLPRHRTAAY
ncbi:hybrid sensor histidine kinase/response regulator [Myxococcus sp. MISCRS1]|uniref:hybrid sensor histidine kinase/response regulator n=1 Tax=Myxococcus TaxID=32 RepID=UPI001CBED284|nr:MULTISPECIES: hybrid sensor histidine kinase/response regulator [unclassified Myxococcus]MBZ4401199.1 hybrid sensor histidine kinase/response regulator [Myxococcus sp. AS-1-15]MBZ4411010.1 hybrid sensor histidine kinase/response regulator [Myxococcus sp. XM-1-1-1]MCY0997042.1 hybrid sensor histidine kinase/response regulator [Myxococcus sp. MISCRS1]BDT32940.1 hybrid sensor histidine kinase/response regulator [Myxococcus sp. MH1]